MIVNIKAVWSHGCVDKFIAFDDRGNKIVVKRHNEKV